MMFWRKKRKTKEEFYQDFLKEMDKVSQKEEREKTLAIITYLADGLLVFDKNSKLSLINPQARKLLKVRGKEVLGKSILRLSHFPNIQPLVSLLGGGIREVSKKELQIKKDFILEVSAVPMVVKGKKISTLVTLHDISREKLVERIKSEFVTLAAHQLRTPASAVKWTLQILLEGDLGELSKEQKEVIQKACETNDKMIKLVNDLLNVAQIEEGKYLSKVTLSDIEEIARSVVDSYKDKIKQRKLKFRFQEPRTKLPKVMVDIEKIEIALRILLDNAIMYTLPGGRVTVSMGFSRKEIEIQVRDTGLGIPEHQRKKVFTKFFRGTNVMRIETEGTGLGLFIAKNIIEAHGGRIWFESKGGRGSTFYFTIPIKEKFGEFLGKEFY